MNSPFKAGVVALCSISLTQSFTFLPAAKTSRNVGLSQLNLFDGMKNAFGSPPLEKSSALEPERETPIDRWMGWTTTPDPTVVVPTAIPSDFIDAMDTANYISAAITKPMGIIFEENDPDVGGIFLLSLSEGGAAEASDMLKPGDQLIAVNDQKVVGLTFDEALGAIVSAETKDTRLTIFRGPSSQLYGPTGASKAWLDEFIAKENS
eukprot:CAMPEP_0171322400 /NCGR_PEP_ID=MMETSP0816-20121228/114931_1 /TAXON_ID=420281 /ORGANISM="Proboscia inermis, Strain CCAP1064/1" /LENGTH=206 /DNA_ID=CAMNT_0011820859 /DNA_START=419 /DNA_END=1039 /DNA_ORIENTATION=-